LTRAGVNHVTTGSQNPVSTWQIDEIVDLDRYPLERMGSDDYQRCVESVRAALVKDSCAVLEGFIRTDRVDRLRAEATQLEPHAVYMSYEHNPYFTEIPDDVAEDDPRRFRAGRTNGMVPADRIERQRDLWQFYTSEALHTFLADCLDVDRIYCYEDPYGSLILSVQECGEEFTWHFDTMEFAVTLLLQESVAGGLFEYAPNIRTHEDECFAHVAEVLAGRSAATRRLELHAGDLQLFRGRHSLHRVTAVEGKVTRLIAVLAYNRESGVYATPQRSIQAWGKTHPDQIIAQRNRRRADGLID